MGTKQRLKLLPHCKTCGLVMMSQQIIALLDTWDQEGGPGTRVRSDKIQEIVFGTIHCTHMIASTEMLT